MPSGVSSKVRTQIRGLKNSKPSNDKSAKKVNNAFKKSVKKNMKAEANEEKMQSKASNKFAKGGNPKRKRLGNKIDLADWNPLYWDARLETINNYYVDKQKPKHKTLEQKKKDVEDYSKKKTEIANRKFSLTKEADFNGRRASFLRNPYENLEVHKWKKHDDKMDGRFCKGGKLSKKC
jgi:hypothetical protein